MLHVIAGEPHSPARDAGGANGCAFGRLRGAALQGAEGCEQEQGLGQWRPLQAAEHASTRAEKVPVTHAARTQDAPSPTPLSVERGFLAGLEAQALGRFDHFFAAAEQMRQQRRGENRRAGAAGLQQGAAPTTASQAALAATTSLGLQQHNAIGSNNKQGCRNRIGSSRWHRQRGHMRHHQRCDVEQSLECEAFCGCVQALKAEGPKSKI